MDFTRQNLKYGIIAVALFSVSFALLVPLGKYGVASYENSAENVKPNRVYVLSTWRESGGKSTTRYWVKFRMDNGEVKNMSFTSGPGAEAGSYWTVYTYNWKRSPDTTQYWMSDPTDLPSYLPYALGGVASSFLAFTYLTFTVPRRRYYSPGQSAAFAAC